MLRFDASVNNGNITLIDSKPNTPPNLIISSISLIILLTYT